MPKKIDMLGKTYGRLKVIEESGRTNGGEVMWRCICECGEERSIVGYDLRSGGSKSCGCLKLEILRDRVSVHNMSRTRFYNIWSKMIQRCNNPNTTEYINYGGRGIKVTDRWLTHEYFMEDILNRI